MRSAGGLLGELGLGLGELCEMIGFLLPECWPQKSAKGARIGRRRTERWPTEHTEHTEGFEQEKRERTEDGFLSQRPRSADTEEAGDRRQIGQVGRPLRARLAR